MSECIKTGCHVFLNEYGSWARGDAFVLTREHRFENLIDEIYFFRFVSMSTRPLEDVKHFTIQRIAHDFDRCVRGRVWTVIAQEATYHGYDGVSIFRKD